MAAGDEPGGFLDINYSVPPALPLESVLFIGTQFSNLYTAVDTPAEAAWLCA